MFRLCIIDNETGNTFDWNGSHTVEISGIDGKVFDVMSFGFNEHGTRPTFAEFASAVERWVEG
jgi:hypothetical protein